jgi:MoxR-like ATPase
VQSALLEVMAERQVSIGGVSHPVPRPFMVLATQNPIESEGVYPLPEAQRDRFAMKVLVDHPSAADEATIVRRMSVAPPKAQAVLGIDAMMRLQEAADAVFVHDAVLDYAVRLVQATRHPEAHGVGELAPSIAHGASPRATLALIACGRALALMRDRTYLLPQDVYDLSRDVLRHRVLITYEAMAEGITAEQVVEHIARSVVAPRVSATQDLPAPVSAGATAVAS